MMNDDDDDGDDDAFNQLASMPTVLVTGPTVMQNSSFLPWWWLKDHRQYSFRLPMERWPG